MQNKYIWVVSQFVVKIYMYRTMVKVSSEPTHQNSEVSRIMFKFTHAVIINMLRNGVS